MNTDELKLLKQAIISEIEGYEFYKMASAQATENSTKQAFIQLAQEEMKHVEWLKGLFESKKNNSDAFDLSQVEAPSAPHFFKWENIDRKHVGVAMSVFGIGMQMEEAAVKYYSHARELAESKEVIELFDILIQWEKNHYEQFYREYDSLREEWWQDQGFAPF